ncbi:hypothetical protein WJX74_007802 [Apatococcus lobatus]|uniref:Uncharacterized protein n=1 Tax=Apatococcus lobatus TaxID=904363 RepID=A0AAW1RDB7_9CHLO
MSLRKTQELALAQSENKRLEEHIQKMEKELAAVNVIARAAQQAASAAAREIKHQRKDLDDVLSKLGTYEQLPAMSQLAKLMQEMEALKSHLSRADAPALGAPSGNTISETFYALQAPLQPPSDPPRAPPSGMQGKPGSKLHASLFSNQESGELPDTPVSPANLPSGIGIGKRQPVQTAQQPRECRKETTAAASHWGLPAMHQNVGSGPPMVQVETMDQDGHVQAATFPVSALTSAQEPDASAAACRNLPAKPSRKSAASSQTRCKPGRPPKANALPPMSSLQAPGNDVLEPHRPARRSATGVRPAELQSIPKQSKADLINWSTTASANKRLKTRGAAVPVPTIQASLLNTQPSGTQQGPQMVSNVRQASRKQPHIAQLPASMLRPFWPVPDPMLPPSQCSSLHPHQQHSSLSSQQSQTDHFASVGICNSASQPATADLLASDAATAVDTGPKEPEATGVGFLQQPCMQLPDARYECVSTESVQKQGVCTEQDMDTAAQGLAAVLQGPQPLLSGVMHAFGNAICACSAVFPDCSRAQRQSKPGDGAPQEHEQAALNHEQAFVPEQHHLAPLWLSNMAVSRFSLTALLHLASRVDEILSRHVLSDPRPQEISDAGAQQTNNQVEVPAANPSFASAARQGMFLEQLRGQLHYKALASLAAGLPSRDNPAQLQSVSAAASQPATTQQSADGLAAACQEEGVAQPVSLPDCQGMPVAASSAAQKRKAPACAMPCQRGHHDVLPSGTSADALDQKVDAAIPRDPAGVQKSALAMISPPDTSAQKHCPTQTAEVAEDHKSSHQSKAAAAGHDGAEQVATLGSASPMQSGPRMAAGALELTTSCLLGAAALGLPDVKQATASLAAHPLRISIPTELGPENAGPGHAAQAHDETSECPACLPALSAPPAQPAPLAGLLTEAAGNVNSASSNGSPSPLTSLRMQHAAALCLASGSLCRIQGNKRAFRVQLSDLLRAYPSAGGKPIASVARSSTRLYQQCQQQMLRMEVKHYSTRPLLGLSTDLAFLWGINVVSICCLNPSSNV